MQIHIELFLKCPCLCPIFFLLIHKYNIRKMQGPSRFSCSRDHICNKICKRNKKEKQQADTDEES